MPIAGVVIFPAAAFLVIFAGMSYETIGDIYSANEAIRERLLGVLAGVSADEAGAAPAGEAWSIQQIAEHLSMVEGGALRICGKLLEGARADGRPGDGTVTFSETFMQQTAAAADAKIQAPERVQPAGEQSIEDSVAKLTELRRTLGGLRGDLEAYDLNGRHFPHPVFGDLTATEWLALLGWHEARHTKQIERILDSLRVQSGLSVPER